MGEITIVEDESIIKKRHADIVDSIFARIRDLIVERFPGVKCEIYKKDWSEFPRFDFTFDIFYKVRKKLFGFIPYTKRQVVLTFNPQWSKAFDLYEESIMDIVKEELANYNKITGRNIPLSTNFVSSAKGSQMIKQI